MPDAVMVRGARHRTLKVSAADSDSGKLPGSGSTTAGTGQTVAGVGHAQPGVHVDPAPAAYATTPAEYENEFETHRWKVKPLPVAKPARPTTAAFPGSADCSDTVDWLTMNAVLAAVERPIVV